MRVQQRASTLKEFVRVSKRGDGLGAKNDVKPAGRITRRRAAELAATALVDAPSASVGDGQATSAYSSGPAAATPTRKRKVELVLAAAASDVDGSPAKRVARAIRTQPSACTPTRRSARKSTISEYFAASPAACGKGSPAAAASEDATTKAVATATAVSLSASEEATSAPMPIDSATAPVGEALVEGASQKSERAARASTLLTRLRNRKRPEGSGGCAVPAATADETRAIQEAIRARREQLAEDAIAGKPALRDSPASFDATKVATAEDVRMRELKRQFVKISPPVGDAAPLPRELRKLEELFQGLEHAVMFDGQGASGVVYHRIRKGVESMAKRTFGWKELGQILAVYPESYTYVPLQTPHDGRRVQSVALTPVARGVCLAVQMEGRRDEFRRRLVALVDSAHRGFLVSRGFGEDDLAGISGWHPAFDIESTPAVTPLALPPTTVRAHQEAGVVAKFDREKLKHLLGSSYVQAPAQQQRTVGGANVSSSAAAAIEGEPPAVLALPTPADSPLLQPADAAGGPAGKPVQRPTSSANALLERIRAKQRAKEKAVMELAAAIPAATRSMHSRLPGILDAVSFLYYAERKSVLQFFYVVDKLVESKGLDRPETAQHLVALAGFVPEWCTISDPTPDNPSPAALLKVARAISLQEARSRLQTKLATLDKA